MTTPTTRTQAEINTLKATWLNSPYWKIEETEGFEAHRDELAAYRLDCETEWQSGNMYMAYSIHG